MSLLTSSVTGNGSTTYFILYPFFSMTYQKDTILYPYSNARLGFGNCAIHSFTNIGVGGWYECNIPVLVLVISYGRQLQEEILFLPILFTVVPPVASNIVSRAPGFGGGCRVRTAVSDSVRRWRHTDQQKSLPGPAYCPSVDP